MLADIAVMRLSLDKYHHFGFTLSPRLSSRYLAKQMTYIDYTDGQVITADTITFLLHHIKNAANDVGHYGL